MLHPEHLKLLEKLKEGLDKGDLTSVNRVGPGTILCITQETPQGMCYYQVAFDAAPADWALFLRDRVKGEKIGDYKIVAIYDMWPEVEKNRVPPVKDIYN